MHGIDKVVKFGVSCRLAIARNDHAKDMVQSRERTCSKVESAINFGCEIMSRGHIAQRALHLLVHSTLTAMRYEEFSIWRPHALVRSVFGAAQYRCDLSFTFRSMAN